MTQQIVKFKNASLIVEVDEHGTPWVAVKPIIDAIGLHADSALKGIKNDEILARVHAVRRVRDASNRPNDMVCMPIQHVHGWLFGIDSSKVNPEAREALVDFKMECYDVLFEHFHGSGKKLRESTSLRFKINQEIKIKESQYADIGVEIKNLKRQLKEVEAGEYRQIGIFDQLPETVQEDEGGEGV